MRILGLVFTCMCMALWGDSLAWTKEVQISDIVRLMQSGKDDVLSLPAAYGKFFGSATVQQLNCLEHTQNTGLAIRAAWERFGREIDRNRVMDGKKTQRCDIVAPYALGRFIGFMQGRLNVPIPTWWISCFRNGETTGLVDRGPQFVPRIERLSFHTPAADPTIASRFHETTAKIMASTNVRDITIGQDGFLVATLACGMNCRIPEKLLLGHDEDEFDVPGVSAVPLVNGRCIVALFELQSTSTVAPLWCINPASGEVIWTSTVWGNYHPVGGSGPAVHTMEILVFRDIVFAFGKDSYDLYLEAFQVDDGTNQFRFSTSY